jgi:hypothetical protein
MISSGFGDDDAVVSRTLCIPHSLGRKREDCTGGIFVIA